MITITVDGGKFQSRMKSLIAQAQNPRAIIQAAGNAAVDLLWDHFRQRDIDDPNPLSSRRTHFWLQVAESIQEPVADSNGARISIAITHPAFAQKVYGGPISPVRAGALTIPLSEPAYARSARDFEQETGMTLFLIKAREGSFLAARPRPRVLEIEYMLRSSVRQFPDHHALPDQETFTDAILDHASDVWDQQMSNSPK